MKWNQCEVEWFLDEEIGEFEILDSCVTEHYGSVSDFCSVLGDHLHRVLNHGPDKNINPGDWCSFTYFNMYTELYTDYSIRLPYDVTNAELKAIQGFVNHWESKNDYQYCAA